MVLYLCIYIYRQILPEGVGGTAAHALPCPQVAAGGAGDQGKEEEAGDIAHFYEILDLYHSVLSHFGAGETKYI